MATFFGPTTSCFKVHIKMSKKLFKPWKKSFEWKVLNVTVAIFFHKSRPWLKKGVYGPETHLMYQNIQITKGKGKKVDQLVILTYITHAALHALSLAVGDTLAATTLASLRTTGAITHGQRPGTLGWQPCAARLLLACGVLCLTAGQTRWHVLAVLAARWVLVTEIHK